MNVGGEHLDTMDSCYPLHRVSIDMKEIFSKYMLEQVREQYPTARIIETVEGGAYMVSVCGHWERTFSDGDLFLLMIPLVVLILLRFVR